MKPNKNMIVAMTLSFACAMPALAGEAATSATAGSNGWGPGHAAATATYEGNGVGYTDTSTRSGQLNLARGLSVGFDEDGLSFSSSYAVAPQFGPAVAGTFNLNVGLDGQVSSSVGRSVAEGDPQRQVSAGGSAGSTWGQPTATATASGETGPRGEVRAVTRSDSSRGESGRPEYLRRAQRLGQPARRVIR